MNYSRTPHYVHACCALASAVRRPRGGPEPLNAALRIPDFNGPYSLYLTICVYSRSQGTVTGSTYFSVSTLGPCKTPLLPERKSINSLLMLEGQQAQMRCLESRPGLRFFRPMLCSEACQRCNSCTRLGVLWPVLLGSPSLFGTTGYPLFPARRASPLPDLAAPA